MTIQWTTEREAQFARLWNDGATVAEIERTMKISQATLDLLRKRLGLTPRKPSDWSDAHIELIKSRWARGDSASMIARDLPGRTRNAVIGKIHRLGLTDAGRGKASKPKRATFSPMVRKPRPKPAPIPGVSATLSWKSPVSTAEDQRVRQAEGAAAHQRVARGVNVESPNARPFMEATEGCKWPLGDRGAISYCCNPLAGGEGWGRTWCAGHVAVGLADAQPRGLAPKDAVRLTRHEGLDRYRPARPAMPVSAWDDAREAA